MTQVESKKIDWLRTLESTSNFFQATVFSQNSVKSTFSLIVAMWIDFTKFCFCMFFTVQCGKTRNSLTEKKFRQITYLIISLVKAMLSRNFCEKNVRDNFCNFHSTVWKLTNFCLALQNFFNFLREINAIKVLFSKMASENSVFDQVRANLRKNDFTKS